MQTITAKWFHAGRLKPIRLIVIHCTVSLEMGTGAEAVARYFAAGERRASAHRVADNNSTVICVQDGDTAYGAAGANSDGIHLELVGQPTQTRGQWLDAFSTAELFQAGLSVREWSREYGVPLRWLSVAQVADGKTKGLCTHHDVSRAFPEVSTGHWDPGPNFPKDEALRIWTPEAEPPAAPLEDDMAAFELWRDSRDGKLWRVAPSGLAKLWIRDERAKNVDYYRQGSKTEHTAGDDDAHAWLDSVPTVTA